MTTTQRHNFMLILRKVRGRRKLDRMQIYSIVRYGPVGVLFAAALLASCDKVLASANP